MTLDIRPRTDWQNPAQPVVGPRMVLPSVTMLPAHYTAAATVSRDTAALLRSIQNDYTVNRGYSIGYNFAVDQAAVAWECRGFDIKCAANKGMNDVTIAVLCLVDGANAMNPAMVETFRQLGAEAQRRVGDELLVVGHRDIGSTACPGDGIYGQVVTGQLEPADDPTPQPPEPPTPGDTDMATSVLILDDARDPYPRYRCAASTKTWVVDGNASAQLEQRLAESAGGTKPAVDGMVYVYMRHGGDDVIASYGPIVGPLPPARDQFGRAT